MQISHGARRRSSGCENASSRNWAKRSELTPLGGSRQRADMRLEVELVIAHPARLGQSQRRALKTPPAPVELIEAAGHAIAQRRQRGSPGAPGRLEHRAPADVHVRLRGLHPQKRGVQSRQTPRAASPSSARGKACRTSLPQLAEIQTASAVSERVEGQSALRTVPGTRRTCPPPPFRRSRPRSTSGCRSSTRR